MGQGLEGTEKPVVDAGWRESVKKFHQKGCVFWFDWAYKYGKPSRGDFVRLVLFRVWTDD